ncbi:MAG TPA: histidine kinase dimerization/phospho-acceptor domain-containing protein [Bacillota bacterium]|nr:histidine kinase dimerization/phospho-acceptor domain-containing protein [Bacillota bacterium]
MLEPSQSEALLGSPVPQIDKVMADLESLSYSLSHNLRAPLRSIHGFAQLLLQDYQEKVGAAGQDYLQRIMGAALHMDELVQQVLAFHQLLYTQLPLERLDLKRFIRRLLKCEPERTLPIAEVQVPPTLPAVLGSDLALKTCLSNWLICLARYYPQHLTPRLRLWAEQKDTRVRLWLSSLNSGLSPEEEQLLHSACLSAAKTGEITDLGLAVVRKAAQAMNGQTGMEFIPGQGLQFWLELSVAPIA